MQLATHVDPAQARQQLLAAVEEFSDLPREVLVKSDLLRLGVAFDPHCIPVLAQSKKKSYFIFSFDRVTRAEMDAALKMVLPEEMALQGGPWDFARVIVSTRYNPHSPYVVVARDERLWLTLDGETLCAVQTEPPPTYYGEQLPGGKTVQDLAPTIEWGYLIYLTAFRLCQYWGADEECRFCDINNNYRQHKQEGRPYTGVKAPEDIVAALRVIAASDSVSQAYTVTGGSVTDHLQQFGEAEFYARYARAIEAEFPGRWIGKAVVQALPRAETQVLKDAGYRVYHPNYEVWDARCFEWLCPGKTRYVGRDEWHRRIVESADVFGAAYVIPNFVAGIEMAQPNGCATVEEAVQSTTEGLEYFMARGVCPRFTVWCVEPGTQLADNQPAPLRYYGLLLRSYRETFVKYALPIPPGYGEAGLGRAVFSVSPFMDVLG